MSINKKSVLIAAFGTMLEYYDYAIFSIFLPIIAPVFFPAHSKYEALVKGFYAILIIALARPLGGIIFGYIGDKFGRRMALLISLYGIALATLSIGFIPGYVVIGFWSMIMITTIRAVQMLCYGGEYSGAGIYVVELANGHKEGFIGSVLSAMALFGSVIASVIGMVITYMNKDSPNWRIAFILGGVLGVFAVIFRRDMAESADLEVLRHRISFRQLFKSYPYQIFAGACIGGFITLPFTTVLSFINPLLATKGYLNNFQFMLLQFGLSIVAVVVLLVSGMASDRYTPYKIMKFAALGLIILAIPLSTLLASQVIILILISEIILITLNEMLLGPSNGYLKSLFPVEARYRGVAFSFCLGMSISGGLTPVVENWLFSYTGSLVSISIWLIFLAGLTLLSLYQVKKRS